MLISTRENTILPSGGTGSIFARSFIGEGVGIVMFGDTDNIDDMTSEEKAGLSMIFHTPDSILVIMNKLQELHDKLEVSDDNKWCWK